MEPTNPDSSVDILEADLNLPAHQQDVLALTAAYALDPMGNGGPLPAEALERLIPGLRNHPTTLIFLAYKNQQAVGLATCFRGFSTFAAQPLINISDLAVLPKHRGQGIGRHMLAAVEKKARELGCCKVTLEVQENNAKARRTYEQAGFTQARLRPNHRRLAVLLEEALGRRHGYIARKFESASHLGSGSVRFDRLVANLSGRLVGVLAIRLVTPECRGDRRSVFATGTAQEHNATLAPLQNKMIGVGRKVRSVRFKFVNRLSLHPILSTEPDELRLEELCSLGSLELRPSQQGNAIVITFPKLDAISVPRFSDFGGIVDMVLEHRVKNRPPTYLHI